MPHPEDLSSLRSFLGGVIYYSKFLMNLQSVLYPLHQLLKKEARFVWTSECQDTFNKVKHMIIHSPLLVHYDPSKPIVLICDASPYGVGAVLNIVINNEERPCYMISSSLSPAEKNYSQLHREALAIVFAVKKLHKYILGYKVTIYTDCNALESILSKEKNLDTVINSRLIRWILFLQNYDLEIKFRPSKYTKCADVLSRLPIEEGTNVDEMSLGVENCYAMFNDQESQVVQLEQIRLETERDPLAKEVYNFVINGWPINTKVKDSLKRFYSVKDSLDTDSGCLFYGNRVFIPCSIREKVLSLIHREHVGVVKCKQLARNSVWWPNIDQDIEYFVKRCQPCNLTAPKKREYPLMSWKATNFPFERIHLDHFHFQSKIYLVIVDAYSNWVHVEHNSKENSECVLLSLKKFCAIFGLPKIIVTDNGTSFVSTSFEHFCKVNLIEHKTSPQYHPQSNGIAERYVGIVKQNLKKYLLENKSSLSIESQIQNFLFKSHVTPMSDNISPADKVFKYKPITLFSQMQKPIQPNQSVQKTNESPVGEESIQSGGEEDNSWDFDHTV